VSYHAVPRYKKSFTYSIEELNTKQLLKCTYLKTDASTSDSEIKEAKSTLCVISVPLKAVSFNFISFSLHPVVYLTLTYF
jgi:hypothetical protein